MNEQIEALGPTGAMGCWPIPPSTSGRMRGMPTPIDPSPMQSIPEQQATPYPPHTSIPDLPWAIVTQHLQGLTSQPEPVSR